MATTPISSQELEWIRASVPRELEVPVSTKELERRWTAVRRAMEDRRIDALVVYGDGYARWFTDGVAAATVFPESVEVRGPRSEVDALDSLRTLPIDITGEREKIQRQVELDPGAPGLALEPRRCLVIVRFARAGPGGNGRP